MTIKDTQKILAYFREAYPNGARGSEHTVRLWHDLLEEYDFEVAWVAAKIVVRTWQGYTMPPPAALIAEIENLYEHEDSAIDNWRLVEKAIKRGSVFTQSEFNDLPEVVQRYFGGVSAIRDLAYMNRDQLPNERARFMKLYETLNSQIKAVRQIPESVRLLLETREEK